ncbi:MAG: hypothetical protein AAF243_14005 [Cyanobacteria bacterium P01_A01_bin.137]
MTQLTGDYAISWLPWIMIPLIFYILPFPIFAIIFLWIERESDNETAMGQDLSSEVRSEPMGADAMGTIPPS